MAVGWFIYILNKANPSFSCWYSISSSEVDNWQLFLSLSLLSLPFGVRLFNISVLRIKGVKIGILSVVEDDGVAERRSIPTVANIVVILEEAVVVEDIKALPSAVGYLLGLLYACIMEYPKGLQCTFKVIQKSFLELDVRKCSARAISLRNKIFEYLRYAVCVCGLPVWMWPLSLSPVCLLFFLVFFACVRLQQRSISSGLSFVRVCVSLSDKCRWCTVWCTCCVYETITSQGFVLFQNSSIYIATLVQVAHMCGMAMLKLNLMLACWDRENYV